MKNRSLMIGIIAGLAGAMAQTAHKPQQVVQSLLNRARMTQVYPKLTPNDFTI